MNIVLLGYPGSGKGTQAEALCKKMSLMHISTGDMFREEISKRTELGAKVGEYLATGKLVDDDTVLNIIKKKIETYKQGFLFDGFPRTFNQAEGLDDLLSSEGKKIDAVIFLNINSDTVISRLSSRRVCSKCSRVYNAISIPPVKEGVCDACGGEVIQREDDKPEVVEKRIMVYAQLTEPLISYYKANGVFYEIDADAPAENITGKILSFLEKENAPD